MTASQVLRDDATVCPRCGGEIGVFAATEEREDCADLWECERCGASGEMASYAASK